MTNFVFLKSLPSPSNGLMINDTGNIKSKTNTSALVLFLRINKEINVSLSLIEPFRIENTGDRFEKKVCDRCFKLLITSQNFSGNRLKKGDVITNRPSCKSCRVIKDGVSISARNKTIWEAKKPINGTLFACPICTKISIVGVSKIVLDHCHQTGEVRGYLCESCNTGIGRFDDDPKLVERAGKWLEK